MVPEVIVESLANVHSHLREGDIIAPLIEKAIMGGADVLGPMPNTTTGLTTASQVHDYMMQVRQAVPAGKTMSFIPFIMITEKTTKDDIDDAIASRIRDAKIYPLNRTTKSQNGVESYGRILPIVKYCGEVGMKCHFHPEHPSMLFSSREAEFVFLPIAQMFLQETEAIIVWEHGTDARCIPHWIEMAKSGRFYVTLTAHHLATTEDEVFGDVRGACKPPIKLLSDQLGLIWLVTQNFSWVMAGGDDAFHDAKAKHVDKDRCACGAYTGPFLLQLYAHALEKLFETEAGIQTFVNFTSQNARCLHNLKGSSARVKLVYEPWEIPLTYPIGSLTALPFWAGRMLNWKIRR